MTKNQAVIIPIIRVRSYQRLFYEDAEDTTTDAWYQYSGGTIRNITAGADDSLRAIEITGDIYNDAFRLGQRDGSEWENSSELFLELSMILEESGDGAVYIQVDTSAGMKYLVYSDGVSSDSNDPDLIYVGLGNIADGQWQAVFRDLDADLKTVLPQAQLNSVKGFFVYGSMKLDNISLLNLGSKLIN